MKKTVLTSLVLVTVGILFGAILVSNFSGGVDLSFARSGGEVKLGGPTPVTVQGPGLKAISDNFVAVAKAVTPSVVAITVTTSGKKADKTMPHDFFHFFGPDFKQQDPQPEQGMGSGVIITADGYIVTNNHVVDDADKDGIEVVMNDKLRYKAKLVGTDPSTDLAVVKIDAKDLPAAALGNSDNVQVGEWALAIGNPLGLTSTVTAGIISAKGRSINIIRDNDYSIEDFIQTDAAINPGNSGGALVNLSGELIGINTAIATTNARYQGYGFAVPVNILKTVAADLIKEGKVRRGYIGVKISAVDQTMASALGMKETKGVLIQSTVKGGAGEAAGLKEGDVILSVDGKGVNAGNELQSYIATHHPGDRVIVKIYREGSMTEKTVTLKAREEEKAVVNTSEPVKEDEESSVESPRIVKFDNLGLSVRSMTPDEKKELEVDRGVIIADVRPYGEAFNRAIGKNMVIVEADRKQVNSPADLKKIVDGRKPGDSVLLRIRSERGTSFVALKIQK